MTCPASNGLGAGNWADGGNVRVGAFGRARTDGGEGTAGGRKEASQYRVRQLRREREERETHCARGSSRRSCSEPEERAPAPPQVEPAPARAPLTQSWPCANDPCRPVAAERDRAEEEAVRPGSRGREEAAEREAGRSARRPPPQATGREEEAVGEEEEALEPQAERRAVVEEGRGSAAGPGPLAEVRSTELPGARRAGAKAREVREEAVAGEGEAQTARRPTSCSGASPGRSAGLCESAARAWAGSAWEGQAVRPVKGELAAPGRPAAAAVRAQAGRAAQGSPEREAAAAVAARSARP